jgi:hypothetical protein
MMKTQASTSEQVRVARPRAVLRLLLLRQSLRLLQLLRLRLLVVVVLILLQLPMIIV